MCYKSDSMKKNTDKRYFYEKTARTFSTQKISPSSISPRLSEDPARYWSSKLNRDKQYTQNFTAKRLLAREATCSSCGQPRATLLNRSQEAQLGCDKHIELRIKYIYYYVMSTKSYFE